MPRYYDTIVYTMGKCASTTVARSLQDSGINCYDVHCLQLERLSKSILKHSQDSNSEKISLQYSQSLYAYNACRHYERVRIVTLLREPVMRNLSAAFQNLPAELKGNTEEIVKRVLQCGTQVPDGWFHNDFIPVTKINIFDEQINPSRDHFFRHEGNFDILIIKISAGNNRMSELLSTFFDTEIKITNRNEMRNKWYKDDYNQVKNNLPLLGKKYLEECFSLRYFTKFYSVEERRNLAEKYGYYEKIAA